MCSEVRSRTFGVLGLGNIGFRIAQLAQAFGADVLYWSRNRKEKAEQEGITYSEKLFTSVDILSVNLALNHDTEGYIDKKKINQLKKDSIVVNTSPMELFDFDALYERLQKNDMTLILDHTDEMTQEQLGLLNPLENCVLYPAMAYLTKEASELKERIFIDNIANFLNGTPTHVVS